MVKPVVSIMLRAILIVCIVVFLAPIGLITGVISGIVFVIDVGFEGTLSIISGAVRVFDYNQMALLVALTFLLISEAICAGWTIRFALWYLGSGIRFPRQIIYRQAGIISEDYKKLRRLR